MWRQDRFQTSRLRLPIITAVVATAVVVVIGAASAWLVLMLRTPYVPR